ncbi:MAG: hypothetical protein DI498_07020 [Paracoccus denitrificans]|nr:MAG: hypothetical protein DI498_07020 [Paracoccus denitrificans]PZO84641.1 MAG: hypothetical protein DI633_07020 [Paracoccus denitrificans]
MPWGPSPPPGSALPAGPALAFRSLRGRQGCRNLPEFSPGERSSRCSLCGLSGRPTVEIPSAFRPHPMRPKIAPQPVKRHSKDRRGESICFRERQR